ncbi:MAG TPA: preprotein translocase subunit Sec61beta [Candidatus Aenigmarchaeota archaeon]|nr:preprotein translocase subunit Sec61beta [Candidatus Aenigmarchaeota archaeon]
MKKNKINMPMSTAGLIRYFDESEERIKIKPEHVIIFSIILLVVELFLKFMG